MVVTRDVVSHALSRRQTVRAFRAGRLARESVCDADPLVRSAALHHGRPRQDDCPICSRSSLYEVAWVFGDNLGRAANSARSDEEIATLVDRHGAVTVHDLEVCPHCGWNHLVRSKTVTGEDPDAAQSRGVS